MMFLADSFCSNEDLLTIIGVVKSAYTILQIGVPIILLVIGTVDLGKAVMAGDEKEIKSATGMLMKRAGAAVGVFLLIYIVQFITGLLPVTSEWRSCWGNPAKAPTDDNGQNDNDETDKQGLGYLNY